MRPRLNRVNIHRSHPNLYYSIMTLGLTEIALAFNFWSSNPTFNPYGINKNIIGAVFFGLGLGQIVFLNIVRDLSKVRIILAISIGFTFAWAIVNTQQSFRGKASFQLPILYLGLCALQVPLAIESPVNPMTEKKL